MTVVEWKLLTEFLALSGLRFGEAAAAFKQLIDLKDEAGTSRYELYPDFRKLFLVEGENSDENKPHSTAAIE